MIVAEVAEVVDGTEPSGASGEAGVADVEYRLAAGPPTGGAGRGEIPPWPSTLEDGEWQVLHLERAITEIRDHLATPPERACALTGKTPDEYEAWRAKAERALAVKERQHAERRLWVRQQRRALGQHRAAEEVSELLHTVQGHFREVAGIRPTTPDADALLCRASGLLRAWAQEFEPEEVTGEERAVLGLLEDYLSLRGQAIVATPTT